MYYLAATPRRLLRSVDGTSIVKAVRYEPVKAFGYDQRDRLVFVRYLDLALSSESCGCRTSST